MTKTHLLMAVIAIIIIGLVALGAVWLFVPGGTPTASAPNQASGGEGGNELAADSTAILFQIDQAESEARFTLGEVLRGTPTTVVGSTNQVTGQIAVDPGDPASAQVGVIQIDAGSLVTDNDFRNRAIQGRILQSDAYQFITFTPSTISGLPDEVALGQALTFQITGDLAIRDATREVTFDVSVTPVSETRLEGLGSATISYADYGITIPSVPGVANVDEQVLLELDFVALAGR